jgi:hypothetical protein
VRPVSLFCLQFVTVSRPFVTANFHLSQFEVHLSQSHFFMVDIRNQLFIFASVSCLTNVEFRKNQVLICKSKCLCQIQEYH